MIGIIDYGAGNLKSVQNSLDRIGAEWCVVSSPGEAVQADGLILPGVGAFGDAVAELKARGLDELIKTWTEENKPLLGICLGLQLLFEYSEESPGAAGLSVFAGGFKKIPAGDGLKVPHIGWNSLDIKLPDGIFKAVENGAYAYFVHSYYLDAADNSVVAATAGYGVTIDAAVEKGNISACQFHPEKSGEDGMKILRNFAKRCENYREGK